MFRTEWQIQMLVVAMRWVLEVNFENVSYLTFLEFIPKFVVKVFNPLQYGPVGRLSIIAQP